MKPQANGFLPNSAEGERKSINSELWHACAGPLISLPPVGSLVVYFPQGHSEQVAASMQKEADFIPNYPNLPSQLICMLHNVTMHADPETDEVYAQMNLQPINKYEKEAILASDMGLKQNRQPTEFFCKTLTASDTSTHGGFSVPRRAAEKIFPPLDHSLQPPAQELVARDLHDTTWSFRHIYRGQPKRHLLTTGWSVFVSTKRLFAGDSVLFIRYGFRYAMKRVLSYDITLPAAEPKVLVICRDEKSQLLLGIKRANRQQPALSSSVISSDSMHIGILAAAAHAAANNSPFTIFYNPRASPSEFVIPLAKYNKAMYTQVSLGMRFRMMFETEESGVRRYMGTVTGISDLDPVRWKNSKWRNLQVGWDESTAGERPSRVSIWDIEPVVTPFYICPPPFFRPKFPKQPGMPDDESDIENSFKRAMPWLGDEFGMKDATSSIFPGLSLVQWMSMQQNQFPAAQSGFFPSMVSSTGLHNNLGTDDPSKLLNFQASAIAAPNLQFNKANPEKPVNQMPQLPTVWSQQQQLQQLLQNPINHQQQQHPQPQQQQQLLHPQQSQQQQQQQQNHHHNQQLQRQPQTSQLQPPLTPPHSQSHSQPQSLVPQRQQQQQQQQFLPTHVNNGILVSNPNQNVQQPNVYSQLQQQQLLASNTQTPQGILSNNKNSYQLTSSAQDSQFQQQMEQSSSLLQRQQQQTQLQQSTFQFLQQSLAQRAQQQPQVQQLAQQSISEQQLQFQLQQKLQQQQQQQLLSPTGSLLQSQQLQQQVGHQQNQQVSQQPPSLNHQQLSNSLSASVLAQPQQLPMNQPRCQKKSLTGIRSHSNQTDGDAPSCSTSPSTNNCQVSTSNFLNRNQQGPAMLVGDSVIEPAGNLVQELQSKSDRRIKHELPISKGQEHLKYKGSMTDQVEASSSGTPYCLDPGNFQQNFSLPTYCLDGDAQSHSRNSLPLPVNIDGMAPDTLLSSGYDSQKDLQNFMSNYGGTPRDIETELSPAAVSSQSFGVPNMPFKPACSNEVAINESGVLSHGLWANQTQRMRTYTKVQKRGSVGRSIDVTRYRDYDELRHDLARMFGIEGQLEDPQSSDWKLVYVDREDDILLVGDDPWEEFLSCVQSIKILSSAEVQQMSLDGDLGNVPAPNQACSGTDGGNAWRHYDDNSAASF